MPLRLEAPRAGRTPYYRVRGTFLGVHVDRTAGTRDKKLAQEILQRWSFEIVRGEYRDPNAPEVVNKPPATFGDAALAYVRAGGDGTYLAKITDAPAGASFCSLPIERVDQIAIDVAAVACFQGVENSTRNRQFYTPVIAVLRRAGITRQFKRPKGANGNRSTSWLEPCQAFSLISEARTVEPEFGLLCLTLVYTGMRIGEALSVRLKDLNIDRAEIHLEKTKNGDPRLVHLPPVLVQAFRMQPPRRAHEGMGFMGGHGPDDGGVPFLSRHPQAKLFRFYDGSPLRKLLTESMKKAGLSFPRRQGGFHLLRHTWATWMRKFGGLDTSGLVSTGVWKDRGSAARYEHLNVSDEARRADTLPVPPRILKSV